MEIPCWSVEWKVGKSAFPLSRMFYSDLGQKYENAAAWMVELSKNPEVHSMRLEVYTYTKECDCSRALVAKCRIPRSKY